MEGVRNFHIRAPRPEPRPGTPKNTGPVGGNNKPPPLDRQTTSARENHNGHGLDYLEYFQMVLQRLGGDTLANRELATVITDKQTTVTNTNPT
jgi:hypothetical protein